MEKGFMSGDDYSNGFLTTNVMFGTGLGDSVRLIV